ncbi:alkaline phosphatase family protein, partial [Trinickia sp.]|uniref:alkaline phosphatase family protein n=1 Tax=Trinickia sp. TaxID=2571163 RepID=UPI003F7FF760
VTPPETATAPDNSIGEFDNFDFKRFGVRVPALLISPRIAAGTVYRASSGTIDHTSVLKTIEERWNIPPLTRRDAAAPSLGDALSLSQPRTDDPLAGVLAPQSMANQPNRATPSTLERLHAWRVSKLPIPDENGRFDHVQPQLNSSAEIGEYIRDRMAAWDSHLRKLRG